MMATSSIDKTVKIWDTSNISSNNNQPKCVAYKTMNVGKLFTLQYSPDDPYLLACAGDTGMVAVWESDELATIQNYFHTRVVPSKSTYSSLQTTTSTTADTTTDTTTAVAMQDFSTVEMAISEKPDESWMDSNPSTDTIKETRKKKKNKNKTK